MLLSALDQTIVSVALPKVVTELNGNDLYVWVVTIYLLTSTISVPFWGKASDLWGRKPIFLIGIGIFLVGSALSGLSQTMPQLIAFRGLQGIGAGSLFPVALAIIGDLFTPAERGKYQGLIGAMFAPRPERVARELLRVCSPGGTIAMGNWTAEGFVGQMFKTFAKFIAPSGMPAPVLWGNEAVVRERLGVGVSDLTMTRRHYSFDYPFPPAEVVELFRQCYGPANRAFTSLGEDAAMELRTELETLWSEHNRGGDEITFVDAEYLEVIAVRA